MSPDILRDIGDLENRQFKFRLRIALMDNPVEIEHAPLRDHLKPHPDRIVLAALHQFGTDIARAKAAVSFEDFADVHSLLRSSRPLLPETAQDAPPIAPRFDSTALKIARINFMRCPTVTSANPKYFPIPSVPLMANGKPIKSKTG